jgi:TrmH family RNA methyltransferase
VPFTQAVLTGKIAIVVGNEAHGMDDAELVDQWITIPHRGRSESLNVAMAATVVCFEVANQRDNAN